MEAMSRTVLSIQSSVAHGHVGNAAAGFILQRMGLDVIRLDTVVFSNHPGRGGFRGAVVGPEALQELVRGLDDQALLGRADAVLSGYLGAAANGPVVLDALRRVRRDHPDALYCCDPVLGDRPKGLYVASDIPAFVRERLIPVADMATPNVFELELLTERPVTDRSSALAAAWSLLDRGPSILLVTGLPVEDRIETLAVDRESAWVVRTPALSLPTSGAGDALTALFLARHLEKPDLPRALSLSVSTLHRVLERTVETAGDELRLVACQGLLPAPTRLFRAEPAE